METIVSFKFSVTDQPRSSAEDLFVGFNPRYSCRR
jgi:hypothetical protein